MNLQLTDRTVLVTGAGQGIGREIGLAFAHEGANVVFHYLHSQDGAVKAAEEAAGFGVRACAVGGDLADREQVARLVAEARDQLGPIDVLINNAAYTSSGPFLDASVENMRQQVDATVLGTLQVTQEVLPDLVKDAGTIVTMAGESGRVGESRSAIVSACRASAYGFTKAIAKEFARYHVRANCVSLGLVRSPSVEKNFLSGLDDGVVDRIVKAYPLRRLGEMADVVPAVLYLASPVSSWTTGQVLSVNGGFAMG